MRIVWNENEAIWLIFLRAWTCPSGDC